MFIEIIHITRPRLAATCGALALASCAGTALEAPADHPARPGAVRPIQLALLSDSLESVESDDPSGYGESSEGHDHDPPSAHSHRDAGVGPEHVGPAREELADKDSTARYTCPMHPEVVRDKPGNCPLCGMKLVDEKKEPQSGGER